MDSAYADLGFLLDDLGIPGVRIETKKLTIGASDTGFDIAIFREGRSHLVAFGYLWHEHFEDQSTALEFVLIGLTPGYRLIESVRWGRPIRATLQVADADGWRNLSQTGLLSCFWPWPRPQRVIRQNNLASVDAVRDQLSGSALTSS